MLKLPRITWLIPSNLAEAIIQKSKFDQYYFSLVSRKYQLCLDSWNSWNNDPDSKTRILLELSVINFVLYLRLRTIARDNLVKNLARRHTRLSATVSEYLILIWWSYSVGIMLFQNCIVLWWSIKQQQWVPYRKKFYWIIVLKWDKLKQ